MAAPSLETVSLRRDYELLIRDAKKKGELPQCVIFDFAVRIEAEINDIIARIAEANLYVGSRPDVPVDQRGEKL